MLLQGMGELVSVNILQRDEYEPSSWKTICTPNPMYVSLALEAKSMWGACIQHYDSMRSSWRSPRRQNLSCSTCLDHPRTVWAMKTVSLTVRIALWLFLFQRVQYANMQKHINPFQFIQRIFSLGHQRNRKNTLYCTIIFLHSRRIHVAFAC